MDSDGHDGQMFASREKLYATSPTMAFKEKGVERGSNACACDNCQSRSAAQCTLREGGFDRFRSHNRRYSSHIINTAARYDASFDAFWIAHRGTAMKSYSQSDVCYSMSTIPKLGLQNGSSQRVCISMSRPSSPLLTHASPIFCNKPPPS